MTYYIDLVNSDPKNDCRGVYSKHMLEDFISDFKDCYSLLLFLKSNLSTKQKLEIMNKLKEVNLFGVSMILEDLEEQLDMNK